MPDQDGKPKMAIAMRSESFTTPVQERELVDEVSEQIKRSPVGLPSWYTYYAKNHSNRIAFDLQMVERYVAKDLRIVEFGSVPLLLTGALAARGYDVVGVDVEPSRFDAAARSLGVKVVACIVERGGFPFEDAAFGAVIFNEIFEHLRIDLIHTFLEILRVLAPGGLLLLSTPDGRSYANLLNLIVHDRGLDCDLYGSYEALQTVGHMGHVREYTATEVI